MSDGARLAQRIGSAVPIIALVGALGSCGGGSSALAQRDPSGYKACQELVRSRDPDVPEVERLAAVISDIGRYAKDSTTESIRNTAKPILSQDQINNLPDSASILADTYDVDTDALAAACRDQGIDVPTPLPSVSP